MRRHIRMLVLSACAAAGCGDSDDDVRRDPFADAEASPAKAGKRAAPHWERVMAVAGTGEVTRSFDISKTAIQWRARWRCSAGRMAVEVSPPPESGRARVGDDCPGTGSASWVTTGRTTMTVDAPGRWRVVIEQEVDTPLYEPPLPGMRRAGASLIAKGSFYPLEKRGSGTAKLFRLPNDRIALRLEDFETASNTDLFVWLSERARPRTSKQAVRTPHTQVALLKSTLGDQNYVLPAAIEARDIRSVVIWCAPIRIAYTAATLRAARS